MASNDFGRPIGAALPDWTPRARPERVILTGSYTRVEPLDLDRHSKDLLAAFADAPDALWTYLSIGPFESSEDYLGILKSHAASDDPLHFAIVDATSDKALGTISLMRHDRASGVIEMGWVTYSPALQGSRIATEAQYLVMKYVFDELGYRRYEWKCDSLNTPSRNAAQRLGFTFEGQFRQATVYKGRTRDTDWFSILDSEWHERKAKFENWLAPSNFDAEGRQIRSLRDR